MTMSGKHLCVVNTLMVFGFYQLLVLAASCPHHCVCSNKMVECHLESMDQFPEIHIGVMEIIIVLANQRQLRKQDFIEFPAVEYLRITNSRIKEIEANTFEGIPSLKHLDISNNSLNALNMIMFKKLPNLRSLDIRYNRFQTLPKHLNKPTQNISLLVSGNPWHCNCDLQWLSRRSESFMCATPLLQPSKLASFNCTAPVITNVSKTTIVTVGETISLRCTANGDPAPFITWILPGFEEQQFKPSTNVSKTENTAVLKIYGATMTDGGIFFCRIYDVTTGFIEKPVTVKIQGERKTIERPSPSDKTNGAETKNQESGETTVDKSVDDDESTQNLVIGVSLGIGVLLLILLISILVIHHMKKTSHLSDGAEELEF